MSFLKDHFCTAKFNKIPVFSTSDCSDNSVSSMYAKNECECVRHNILKRDIYPCVNKCLLPYAVVVSNPCLTKSCNPFYPVIAPQLILAMVKTKSTGYDFHPILTVLADGL